MRTVIKLTPGCAGPPIHSFRFQTTVIIRSIQVKEKMSQFTKNLADYRKKVMQIRHYMKTGGYFEGTDESSKRYIRKYKDKYVLKDGVLYYYTRSKNLVQVLTTEDEILNVLSQCHSNLVGGGHTGIVTTKEEVGSRYFWKNWCKHVEEYVSTCQDCQKVKTQAPHLQQIKVSEPLELVGMDLIEITKRTAQDVSALINTFGDITDPLTNGYVYRIFMDNQKNLAKTCALLIELKKLPTPKDYTGNHLRQMKSYITAVSKNMDDLKNKPDERWNDIVNFLNQPFKLLHRGDKAKTSTTPLPISLIDHNYEANKSTNLLPDSLLCLKLEVFEEEEPSLLSKDRDNFIDINTPQSFHCSPGVVLAPSTSSMQTVKCEACRLKRKSICDLQHEVNQLKNSLKSLMAKDCNKNRQLARKDASIRLWKRKYIEEKKKTKVRAKSEPSEMNEVRILKMGKTKLQQKIRKLERDHRNGLIKLKEEITKMIKYNH